MSKVNCLLEAVGELDNKILENAYKPRLKKRYTIIAAAAAAIALLGCASVWHSAVRFDGSDVIDLNYYAQSDAYVLSAEELEALGATQEKGRYTLAITPSQLFERYNVAPLTNADYFDEEGTVSVLSSSSTQAILVYTLIDKETGNPISIQAEFITGGEATFGANYVAIGGKAKDMFSHYETIELGDGSQAFVTDRYSQMISGYNSQAVLCRNGVGYKLNAKNTDINEMKVILERLGCLVTL